MSTGFSGFGFGGQPAPAATSGLTFGNTNTATVKPMPAAGIGGFGFGSTGAAPATAVVAPSLGGFSFGSAAVAPTPANTGFGLGTNPAATTAGTGLGGGLFGVQTPAAAPTLFGAQTSAAAPALFGAQTPAAGSTLFGTQAPAAGSTLFGTQAPAAGSTLFGTQAPAAGSTLFGTQAPAAGSTLFGTQAPVAGSTLFGTQAPAAGSTLFGTQAPVAGSTLFGAQTSAAGSTLFGTQAPATTSTLFGTQTPATASTLFGTQTAATGTSLFGTAAVAKTSAATLTFGTPAATGTGLQFGTGLSLTTTTASSLSLAPAAGSSIFANTNVGAVTSASKGLGGVDPKTSTTVTSSSHGVSHASDIKAIKEVAIHAVISQEVEQFKVYVKGEKTVREDIARLSSKSMYKVQEDVTNLRSLLCVVSNGLQRNAAAVEKLKWKAAMELRSAEMGQRTKDTPAGLQYENTAPSLYFHSLVEDFESQMQSYRQQIESLESHLTSQRPAGLMASQELVSLLRRLHETFIALCAQLHHTHEQVKVLKEQYIVLQHRLHGSSKNIFESQTKVVAKPPSRRHSDMTGPDPFSSTATPAAASIAAVMKRSQGAGAPPADSLTGAANISASGLGFGSSSISQPGSLGFASNANKTLGGTGLFSSPFGSSPANTSLLPTPITSAFGSATPIVAGGDKPFQLQKPPQGAKRGKR